MLKSIQKYNFIDHLIINVDYITFRNREKRKNYLNNLSSN